MLKRLLLLAVALGFVSVGCTHTCSKMTIERYKHPDKPAPARKYVYKCGDSVVEQLVDSPPECLEKCFKDE